MNVENLKAYLQQEPDGTLDAIAEKFDTTLFAVIQHLPNATLISGDVFDAVWDALTEWGDLTLISHTKDAILEFKGSIPTGTHRHSFFNLRGKQGLTGHIKATNCHHIAFVERKFMGMDTASILFLNAEGEGMFKIFLGRDSHRNLKEDQVIAFRTLARQLSV
ncbi:MULTISPECIES: heme utilization cystosolic carrier protein HutX [Vibrio]|uniref:heme utilization cystosolic carrier protein HutX n=1 Tax=Vibrio TaxID=662 RepID=UPI0011D45B07|nr:MULTISPECIES: heme utilization cystosolic carrier protein HutX [Vibrio]EGR1157624.1 heme utilization cystosolic carrier protein HutX [Vibrio parahaemolyticus]EGQ8201759.1 heme utilization cystosolic carrier protein HutX [Vibrio cholerae]EGQ8673160.1 heme utilization cystosolic carrier protein HutX [Vibrio cholerae]EGR0468859.1 heme utilization cystosolic carrier protein HutX [Vibrio cholerae]EGR1048034.1 heme utilization cystosolic carrier protein HutX [Vibrio cholerae]